MPILLQCFPSLDAYMYYEHELFFSESACLKYYFYRINMYSSVTIVHRLLKVCEHGLFT